MGPCTTPPGFRTAANHDRNVPLSVLLIWSLVLVVRALVGFMAIAPTAVVANIVLSLPSNAMVPGRRNRIANCALPDAISCSASLIWSALLYSHVAMFLAPFNHG